MIIEHYEVFKTELKTLELNKDNWNVLRTESEEKAYAIEDNVADYEKNCRESVSYENSAKCIVEILEEYGGKRIVALGTGKGILEWHLKHQKPDLYVECTDYAEAAIDKLKRVFTECDSFRVFDMMRGDYGVFHKDSFFVLYRVSEELCYSDWCKAFEKMRESQIRNIIYVPDMIATDELSERMKRRHERNIERNIQDTFCGWIYSEDVLEKMFHAGSYTIVEKKMSGELLCYLLRLDE